MALVPSLRPEPLGFARFDPAEPGSVAAARGLGAHGVVAEAGTTDDGGVVLAAARGRTGPGGRWRPRGGRPTVGLGQVLDVLGEDGHLLVHCPTEATATALGERLARGSAPVEVWVGASDLDRLVAWTEGWRPAVRLVLTAGRSDVDRGAERLAARVAAGGVDAVELPEAAWSAGLVTLFHRFGVECVAGDTDLTRQLDRVLDAGVDAVVSRDPALLAPALGARRGR